MKIPSLSLFRLELCANACGPSWLFSFISAVITDCSIYIRICPGENVSHVRLSHSLSFSLMYCILLHILKFLGAPDLLLIFEYSLTYSQVGGIISLQVNRTFTIHKGVSINIVYYQIPQIRKKIIV